MSSMLKRYKKFPLYGSWSSLLNAASWQLPAILLSASFSTTVVGYFVLGFLIIQMPMHIIGNAIGQVFFQRAVEYQIQGKLAELIENVFHQLTLIALFPMLILAVIGKDLYVVLFGHNWAESGIYAQILSVWGFLWLVSSPMSTLFSVLEKQEFGLKWNLVNFLLRLFSLIIGGSTGKPIIAVFLFAFTGLISYGYMNRIILLSAGVSVYHAVKIVRNVLIWFIPAGGCLILCFLLGVHPLVRLSMAAGFVGIWGVFIYRYLVKEHRGQLCFRS